MDKFSGKIWVLGDDIDTDIIIPTEYLALETVNDMAPYAFSPLRPELAGQIKEGDIIVAGKNFGCGSSREHAPRSLMQAGIVCVVAESFARIFYRNSINIGLILVECKIEADEGDILSVDVDNGKIINETSKKSWSFPEYPPYIKELIASGGLMARLKGGK